jgi:hypothetical protein
MILPFIFLSLLSPFSLVALSCLENVSSEVIEPDQANLANSQIGQTQLKIFASLYPTLYTQMSLNVIDCSSTESMKIMGSDIIPYLSGESFFSGTASAGGLDARALHLDGSTAY